VLIPESPKLSASQLAKLAILGEETYGEPAGVAAIIVPWNATVALFIRSLAPALSAGNSVA
jgi:acyl-CoA reductase-like NAD-dependent aldehyde dehydrogenase